ncbi:MAG TPA: hypothetical protein VIH06_07715, partial [Ilumatobacteraceae bacterium]
AATTTLPAPTTTLGLTPGSALHVADPVTFAGMNALSYAAPGATATIVVIDNGSGGSGSDNAPRNFDDIVSGLPPHPGVDLLLVDLADAINSSLVADAAAGVDAIIAGHPTLIANFVAGSSGATANALIGRHQFFLAAAYNASNGIESVLAFYDDYFAGDLGGTPTTYGGLPALRLGPPTATREAVLVPNGAFASTAKAEFAAAATSLPADTSVVMLGTGQSSAALHRSYFDPVLALGADLVLADPAFQIQSGAGQTGIAQYIASNAGPGVQFVALTSDPNTLSNALS